MANLLILGTQRYSINCCDFDLLYRNSKHKIVKVLIHETTTKKDWFVTGKYQHSSRNGIVTKLTDLPIVKWNDYNKLRNEIDKLDFDYICLGNGNDDTGIKLKSDIKSKFMFSEYGFIPWNQCAYIDRDGVGEKSSLFQTTNINNPVIDNLHDYFVFMDKGKKVNYKDFVYVPLQVDSPMSDGKPDFKYRSTAFANNQQFLNFVERVVPPNINILVKNHPCNPRPNKIPSSMIDITKMDLNKLELYQNMKAMLVINSTSAIEAMLFDRPILTYGKDIFSNKGLVTENAKFIDFTTADIQKRHQFLSLLVSRQIIRHKCNDKDYINSHYWTNNI